jgi:hypothetical protein
MLYILKISKCSDGADINFASHTQYGLVHFWNSSAGDIRQWFHSLYKMKGGVQPLDGKWNVVINPQDLDELYERKMCVNRIMSNPSSGDITYVCSTYVPASGH